MIGAGLWAAHLEGSMLYADIKALNNSEYLSYLRQRERTELLGILLAILIACGCIGSAFAM